jgi:hypothetical protein
MIGHSSELRDIGEGRPKAEQYDALIFRVVGDAGELKKIVERVRDQQRNPISDRELNSLFEEPDIQVNMGAYRFYYEIPTNTLFAKVNLNRESPLVPEHLANIRSAISKYADFQNN